MLRTTRVEPVTQRPAVGRSQRWAQQLGHDDVIGDVSTADRYDVIDHTPTQLCTQTEMHAPPHALQLSTGRVTMRKTMDERSQSDGK